jgi:beta-lactamase regulating signal transducer with metallopeptidase domain
MKKLKKFYLLLLWLFVIALLLVLFIVFYRNRMKKFFPVLSRDKASSSANVEAMETQHPKLVETKKFISF